MVSLASVCIIAPYIGYFAFFKVFPSVFDSTSQKELVQDFKKNYDNVKKETAFQDYLNQAVEMLPFHNYRHRRQPLLTCFDGEKSDEIRENVKATLEEEGRK